MACMVFTHVVSRSGQVSYQARKHPLPRWHLLNPSPEYRVDAEALQALTPPLYLEVNHHFPRPRAVTLSRGPH